MSISIPVFAPISFSVPDEKIAQCVERLRADGYSPRRALMQALSEKRRLFTNAPFNEMNNYFLCLILQIEDFMKVKKGLLESRSDHCIAAAIQLQDHCRTRAEVLKPIAGYTHLIDQHGKAKQMVSYTGQQVMAQVLALRDQSLDGLARQVLETKTEVEKVCEKVQKLFKRNVRFFDKTGISSRGALCIDLVDICCSIQLETLRTYFSGVEQSTNQVLRGIHSELDAMVSMTTNCSLTDEGPIVSIGRGASGKKRPKARKGHC